MNINAPFDWKCQPQAENLLLKYLDHAVKNNSQIAKLYNDLLKVTSTRLFDWIDHIVIKNAHRLEDELAEAGFKIQNQIDHYTIYHHPGAQLPRVILTNHETVGIAVSVESIADFILAHGGSKSEILGTPLAHFRKCLFHEENHIALWLIERRGTVAIEPVNESEDYLTRYLIAQEKWERRSRNLENEDEAMRIALDTAKQMIEMVGQNLAAWIVLEGERKYWQSRNTAGQIQKNRQDHLGMGWANHDHHTFRSSRKNFSKLVRLFEMLGFNCRERFYAGQEAGWGAQVMENPVCRLVLFLDVDLAPHEIEGDFAHEGLGELPHLGTIGLWCALHGDSILQAGMHHLEAQFMFDSLTDDLAKSGVKMMNPFSFFPYLKQAFTVGEKWAVDKARVQKLLDEKKIGPEQAQQFIENGALGSHLENLQRREGYKGFNQKNVSIIIKKTDPRLAE